MKSILLSIRPEWVAKILNGEKTIEIRKKFPKDYVGWVYIYCTKDNNNLIWNAKGEICEFLSNHNNEPLNGKVVARFWCDKVEEVCLNCRTNTFMTDTMDEKELYKKVCVGNLYSYLGTHWGNCGYAIHFSKLEVFEKPRELKTFFPFYPFTNIKENKKIVGVHWKWCLTKAPQNYCYIEGEK